MDDYDDEYEGDLQPIAAELAYLKRLLGDQFHDHLEEDLDEGQDLLPAAERAAEPLIAAARQPSASLEERIKAVVTALDANRELQLRLRRLLTSVERAQDQAVDVKSRVQATMRRRSAAAAAPRVLPPRRQDDYAGVSLFWSKPTAPPLPPYPGAEALATVCASTNMPLAYVRRTWSEEEKRALAEGVVQAVQERELNKLLGELEAAAAAGGAGASIQNIGAGVGAVEQRGQEAVAGSGGAADGSLASYNEFAARREPIMSLSAASPEVAAAAATLTDAEWAAVAHRYVPKRSGLECRLQWVNALQPGLKRGAFSAEEDDELKALVESHGKHAWAAVAAELGGGGVRTAVACLGRYQQLSQHAQRGSREFTPADMKRLQALAKQHHQAWKIIAEEFGGPWSGNQLMHFWRRHEMRTTATGAGGAAPVAPRVGKWGAEEDQALLKAVVLLGRKWSKVAALVPGRTDVQCRERFVNVLDPKVKTYVDFTKAEDERLVKKVETLQAGHGDKWSWSDAAACLPGRTDSQCSRRWATLKRLREQAAGRTAKAEEREERRAQKRAAAEELKAGGDGGGGAGTSTQHAQHMEGGEGGAVAGQSGTTRTRRTVRTPARLQQYALDSE